MRSTRRRSTKRQFRELGLVLLAALVLCGATPAEEKRIAIFSPLTSFTLPVVERDGRDFVGLVEVLEPLGTVAATKEGSKWKLRFEQHDAEFLNGQARAKIDGQNFDLSAPFHLENGRGLVPVAALGTLVGEITGVKPIVFHEESRRLFVGKVAVRFTEELRKDTPPVLVLNFTSPASPTIASEPGKVRLTFTREPIMPPPATSLKFDDPVILSTQYEEANGVAVLTVQTMTPLLANFSNEGRTLTLSRAPLVKAATAPPAAPAGGSSSGTPGTPLASGTVEVPAGSQTAGNVAGNVPDNGLRHFFAVIDAAHGGTERGAGLSDELPERDVCLSFARHLLKELQARGISALILRDSDATLSLDQRASLTNSAHPAIYIVLHAATQGQAVRVYTALIPYSGNAVGAFQPWEAAQAPYIRTAVVAATSVAAELRKHNIPARVLSAPLRPLNNVVAAALAVEVSSPDDDLADLVAPSYQQSVAAGIADGIAVVRPQLEAGR
jgi:N-acetylmuramoyl-L-alanine amidase